MLSFLFFTFLFYVLFKLVFDFIIPIYRTTRKVKQGFRNMQQNMEEEQYRSAASRPAPGGAAKKGQAPLGDYIDFEEVKE